MREENREIVLSGADAIAILREIELVMISLHKIGAFYGEKDYAGVDKQEYDSETNRFIDQWQVTGRLAFARRLLTEKFDRTEGPDDVDDVEREMEGLTFWTSPNSTAPK